MNTGHSLRKCLGFLRVELEADGVAPLIVSCKHAGRTRPSKRLGAEWYVYGLSEERAQATYAGPARDDDPSPQAQLQLSQALDEEDALTRAALAESGRHRAVRLQADRDACLRMIGVVNVTPQSELYLLLHRRADATPFSDRDQQRLDLFLPFCERIARYVLLERGFLPQDARVLTELETTFVRMLLRGMREPEIAEATQRSQHAVHASVMRLYAKYGIQTRAQLAALWM